MLDRSLARSPTPPRRLDRAIPRDLETIVLKAMAKDRDERYATAHELADDLRRFLDGEPILARRPSLADRVGKWTRRHRGVVGASFAALLDHGGGPLGQPVRDLSGTPEGARGGRGQPYESLSQRLLRVLLTPRSIGWSRTAGESLDRMAAIRKDDQYRSLESMARRGFDAHVGKTIAPAGPPAFRRRRQTTAVLEPDRSGLQGGRRNAQPLGTGRRQGPLNDHPEQRTRRIPVRRHSPPARYLRKKPGTLQLWDVARSA